MTLDRVLKLLRQQINETDLPVSDVTDSELLEYLQAAIEMLSLRKIASMSSYVVVTDPNTSGYGITPVLTTEHAHMVCRAAALDILREQFRGKLNRGELGINWKSGLEEESTITAAKEWKAVIQDLENELTLLITLNQSGAHGVRAQ